LNKVHNSEFVSVSPYACFISEITGRIW